VAIAGDPILSGSRLDQKKKKRAEVLRSLDTRHMHEGRGLLRHQKKTANGLGEKGAVGCAREKSENRPRRTGGEEAPRTEDPISKGLKNP